jgi:hypothetical protein
MTGPGPFLGDELVVAEGPDGRLWLSDGRCAVAEDQLWYSDTADRFPRGLFPGLFRRYDASARAGGWCWRSMGHPNGGPGRLTEYIAGLDTAAVVRAPRDEVTGLHTLLAVPGPQGGAVLPFESPTLGYVHVEFEQVRGLWPETWHIVLGGSAEWLALGCTPHRDGSPGPVVVQHCTGEGEWRHVAVFAAVAGLIELPASTISDGLAR